MFIFISHCDSLWQLLDRSCNVNCMGVAFIVFIPHDIFLSDSKFFSHFDERRNTSKLKEEYYKIRGGLVSIHLP